MSRASREGVAERGAEVARRAGVKIEAGGIVPLTDEDLYDERGLPR